MKAHNFTWLHIQTYTSLSVDWNVLQLHFTMFVPEKNVNTFLKHHRHQKGAYKLYGILQ